MQIMETEVDCAGDPHTVSTTRQAGETVSEWAIRHRDAVDQRVEACKQEMGHE